MNKRIQGVAFDVHNVLFKPDYQEIALIAWKLPNKLHLIITIINPRFIFSAIKMAKQTGLGHQYLQNLFKQFPRLAQHEQFIFGVICAQKPIQCCFNIATQIKSNGIQLYIFSNMDMRMLKTLRSKYPELFSLFDEIHCVGPDSNWEQKPSRASFLVFLKKFSLHAPEIIFVDNSPRNISAARKIGMQTILYKNCAQLKRAVTQLNILTGHFGTMLKK